MNRIIFGCNQISFKIPLVFRGFFYGGGENALDGKCFANGIQFTNLLLNCYHLFMNAKSFKVPSICQCLVCHVIMHQFDCYGCLFIRSKAKNEVSFLMIAIKAQWNISFNSFGFPVQFWNDYHHHHLPQQLIVTLKTPIKNVLVTTNSYFYQWPYLSSTPSFIQTVFELFLTGHQKILQ